MTTIATHAPKCACALCAGQAQRDRSPFRGTDVEGMPEDLATAERRAILGVLPRRSLWPELAALDGQAGEVDRQLADVRSRLAEAHADSANAPQQDADRLAAWVLAGSKGKRPDPRASELAALVSSLELERDALEVAAVRLLEKRGEFVERNRKRFVRVAEQQASEAHARLKYLLDEAGRERENLIEIRAAQVWAELYPSEVAGASPRTQLTAGGLRKPVEETLGVNQQIDASRVLQLLHADADWCRMAATPEQGALIGGNNPREHHGATWAGSDEHRAQVKAEREAAREAYRREWGQEPGF